MKISRVASWPLVALLVTGATMAQLASTDAPSSATPQTACFVDDRLSVWMSLESADRMIAALEQERRELTETLTKHKATLRLMSEGKMVSEGFTMTQMGILRVSKSGGRETVKAAHDQIEVRLVEVEQTLKRRRVQRARLEEWLNVYLGLSAADGE